MVLKLSRRERKPHRIEDTHGIENTHGIERYTAQFDRRETSPTLVLQDEQEHRKIVIAKDQKKKGGEITIVVLF